jgi:hypothetical protein
LLAGLHEYTGLTLNIIGARINEETQQFETLRYAADLARRSYDKWADSKSSANAGVVDGKDWARWDPEGYSGTLKTYLKFVHAGYMGEFRFQGETEEDVLTMLGRR